MLLRNLFENLARTGKAKAAVLGWGRGMGHKGHMFLASSVITQAREHNADPYFVVSNTVGKDDPIQPDEKMAIYKKVFPQSGHIFHTATEEMPGLVQVLAKLQGMGYTDVTVVVGADQVKAMQFVTNYNGKPDKAGNIPFTFNSLNVISRQETNDPSRDQEGPRATPMRAVLMDPAKNEEEKFAVWRDAMNPELSDDEVRDLMHKAQQRMQALVKPKKGVAEGLVNELSNDLLGRYKKAASADASAADKAGDFKRGDKRFSGIVKATKKQFANDEKKVAEKMMPASNFAGSKKNKLGSAGHLKATDDHARSGDFVGGEGVEEEKQRLDPSCWKGYRKQGTKMKGNTRVNNCVKVGEDVELAMARAIANLIESQLK